MAPNLVQRLGNAVKAARTALFDYGGGEAFSPGQPIPAQAPGEKLRSLDYLIGWNYLITPRQAEARPVTFSTLREMAQSLPLLRAIIEMRKNELRALDWGFRPREEYAAEPGQYQEDVARITRFWSRPDNEHDWSIWLGSLLEDVYVVDAPTLYRRRTYGGDLAGLEVVDGATILLLIDETGKLPDPPQPAYQQIIKAHPRTEWTKADIIYRPFNVRPGSVYGFSPTEDVLLTINIALRRDLAHLSDYVNGTIPLSC